VFALPVFSALLRCNDRNLGSIIEEKAYFQDHEGRAEQDFSIFLHTSVRHRSLTQPFEPFRFWLRNRGDFHNRVSCRLTVSQTHGVVDFPTHLYGESTNLRITDTKSFLTDNLKSTPRIIDLGSRRLHVSAIGGVDDFLYR
jgi:hypothetical protein